MHPVKQQYSKLAIVIIRRYW